jgi:OOP family OmpA-OmpF porin
MKMFKCVGVLAAACCFSMGSQYGYAADTKWYAGISLGQSRANPDNDQINRGLQFVGFTTATITDLKNGDTSNKIYGGYRFTPNFALEGGYYNQGHYRYTTTTTGPAGTLTRNIQPQGANLDMVFILPLADKFSAFGRLGAHYTETRDSFTGSGGVVAVNSSTKLREVNYKLGIGMQYDLTKSVGLRGEWERYASSHATSSGDIDVYSAGVVVKF